MTGYFDRQTLADTVEETEESDPLPKLEELRRLAKGKRTLLAQTHDYPDPDTIASALGLGWLLGQLEGLEWTIGYGGVIGRAENKAMIKVLGIRMKRTTPKDFEKYDLVALLDTQPEVGNHMVPVDHPPDIVFDHHFKRELEGPEPEFYDVGGRFGSTTTKVVQLIMASGLTPPPEVATALFYGVKTDTRNLARQASKADMDAYLYLFPLADQQLLDEIEHPQVPLDWFKVFHKAILRAKIYGDEMIISDLGEIYTPDLCAEVADRMLQIEGIAQALAIGWYQESLFFSLRTRGRFKSAGKVLHGIIVGQGLGTAGGHGSMAGGRIHVEGRSQRARADLRRRIVSGVVAAYDHDFRHFTRVIGKKDSEEQAIEAPAPKASEETPTRRPRSTRDEPHKAAALRRAE